MFCKRFVMIAHGVKACIDVCVWS